MADARPLPRSSSAGNELGRPLPIPIWALCCTGGLVAALFSALFLRVVSGRPVQDLGAALRFAGVAIGYGVACAGLASVAAGRFGRRMTIPGAAVGAGAGLVAVLGAVVHPAFGLLLFALLLSLPSLFVGLALRLRPSAINTLCARSLIIVGAGSVPLLIILVVSDSALHLPKDAVASGFVAICGALAWIAPASHRPGSRLN